MQHISLQLVLQVGKPFWKVIPGDETARHSAGHHTVDGQQLEPVGKWFIPVFMNCRVLSIHSRIHLFVSCTNEP